MPIKDPEKRKAYHKKYMKDVWYPKNRQIHISHVKRLKLKLSNFILEYKRNGKCMDCGLLGKEYPEILEFDHIRNKAFDISLFKRYILSLDRLKEEIKKCELVCANCHRIRTVRRRKNMSG